MDKWLASKESKSITIIIMVVALILLGQLIIFFDFNKKLYQLSYKHSMHQLDEISLYIEKQFQEELERYASFLKIVAKDFENEELSSQEVIIKLQDINSHFKYMFFGISNLEGESVDECKLLYDTHYKDILKHITTNGVYYSNVVYDNKSPFFFIAVPIFSHNQVSGMLWGKYLITDVMKSLEVTNPSFKYFQIIDDSGNYILPSKGTFAINKETKIINIWEELALYEIDKNISIQQIKNKVKNKEKGEFHFKHKKQGRYVSFRPLKIHNWYLFSIQVSDEFDEFIYKTRGMMIKYFIILILGIILIFSLIYNIIYKMYKRISNQNHNIQTINSMFRAILEETGNIPFTVDYQEKQVIFYGYPTKNTIAYYSFNDMKSVNLLAKDIIDKNSVPKYDIFYENLIVKKESCEPVIIALQKNGKKVWTRIRIISNFENSQQFIGVLENYEEYKEKDIQIKKHLHEIKKIEKKSQFDFLTNLYNRGAFMQKVLNKLEENTFSQQNALIILDLDHFKEVNDILGHNIGDKAIQDAAKTLKNFFRNTDIIGRLGGDEFIIYVEHINNKDFFELRIQELNKLLCQTYQKGDDKVQISASIGIVIIENSSDTFADLYEKADQALYTVKQTTKNGYYFYSDEII